MLIGVLALALVVGALVLLAVRPVASDAREPARPAPTFSTTAKTTISVVGDSNTEVDSTNFAAGKIGSGSWVRYLTANGFLFTGGWAEGGTSSATQAQNLAQLEPADVLLIMTGTNDLGQGLTFEQSAADIETIVSKAPASRVVLLAIPPQDKGLAANVTDYNQRLAQLAADHGWEFFDGLGFLRTGDNTYVPGATSDGVHLTRESQQQYGQNVRDYLNG